MFLNKLDFIFFLVQSCFSSIYGTPSVYFLKGVFLSILTISKDCSLFFEYVLANLLFFVFFFVCLVYLSSSSLKIQWHTRKSCFCHNLWTIRCFESFAEYSLMRFQLHFKMLKGEALAADGLIDSVLCVDQFCGHIDKVFYQPHRASLSESKSLQFLLASNNFFYGCFQHSSTCEGDVACSFVFSQKYFYSGHLSFSLLLYLAVIFIFDHISFDSI